MPVIILLAFALVFYSVCEILRQKGISVPVISLVTSVASRKRDENKFVLGPVTLVAGILCAAIFYREPCSSIGIYALAFGDGLASLGGKLLGRVQIPCTHGKTVAGSLTCFAAIFISCFIACVVYEIDGGTFLYNKCLVSLVIASCGMLIELLPLKDFDNILIPVLLGGICNFFI